MLAEQMLDIPKLRDINSKMVTFAEKRKAGGNLGLRLISSSNAIWVIWMSATTFKIG